MGATWRQFKELYKQSHQRAAGATGVVLLIAFVVAWGSAWAQGDAASPVGLPEMSVTIGGGDGDAATIIQIMLMFTLITMAPAIIVMVTPFTRIAIILGLLRNAMGTQQSPPNTVLVGLALFLSLFVMMPVLTDINDNALKPLLEEEISSEEAFSLAQVPLRGFMVRNTRDNDLLLFATMADLDKETTTTDNVPMHVLIPAFMISELKTAFQIGFVIYLPFLVVDMVVASILMSMGMLMLPPILISLPFKLLMFILSDGWNLIFGSIVRSFK